MIFSDEINTSNNFDKINYIDELILKLQLLYSKNIIDNDFFDKALELLKQEQLEIASINERLEHDLRNIETTVDFKYMSIEQQKKYIDIQKRGIKMKLLEAGNFSELNIIYDRIYKTLPNDNYDLENTLKLEFTRNFDKLLNCSYIYYLTKDYNKNYGILDIENLIIDDGELKLNNAKYECFINKESLKKQKIRDIDNIELQALKDIIKDANLRFTEEFIKNKLKDIIKLPINKLNLEEIVKKIKKTIQIILDRDENRFFRSTLTIESDFNFEQKLNKCKKTYNIQFKDEIPFVIFDDTIFKTCENGFIITNKNFYLKNEGINIINIEEIEDIELMEDSLYIKENKILCEIIGDNYREKFTDIIIIITYLIQNAKDASKDIDLIIEEVLDI